MEKINILEKKYKIIINSSIDNYAKFIGLLKTVKDMGLCHLQALQEQVLSP